MNIDFLLSSALAYYPNEFATLLKHLKKCSNQLLLSTPENHLPLLIFKQQEIYLWIKDPGVSDYPFLFSDPEEMLIILYQYFSTGDSLYVSNDIPIELLIKQIEENIERSLLEDNKKEFNYWVSLLKTYNRG